MTDFEELYPKIDENENGTVCYDETVCFLKQFMKRKVKEHVHDHGTHGH